MAKTLALFACFAFHFSYSSAQWNNYPTCAQTCLSNAQIHSGCAINNACLCSNTGDFFGFAAACALQDCDTADFEGTYNVLVVNCHGSGYTVSYSFMEFENAGLALLSPTSSTTVTSISISSPTSTVISSFPLVQDLEFFLSQA
jgi:hypothetical protein